MNRFLYVSWFRDPQFEMDDQDYEWPASFLIIAKGPELALDWGNRLSVDYSNRTKQQFFRSYIDETYVQTIDDEIPVIEYGDNPTDNVIGW